MQSSSPIAPPINNVDFTDLSTGVPAPGQWSWTFQNATPASSGQQHPQNVVFNSNGTWNITLTATNDHGSDTDTQQIVVRDDEPLAIDEFSLTNQGSCTGIGCTFPAGSPVDFTVSTSGSPTGYEFDWDADGTYEEIVNNPGPNPVAHTFCFTTFNAFRPRLRIRRGNGDPIVGLMLPIEGLILTAGSACTLPATPTSLTATGTATTIELGWTDGGASESGFRVLRTDGTVVGGELVWTHIATTPANVTNYSDTSAIPGTVYTYEVYAFNYDGVSNRSNSASAEILLGSPTARDDLFSTGEDSGQSSGDLFADNGNGIDFDPNGGTLSVVAVDGNPAGVGQTLTLSSGALLTVQADGTMFFDPNGGYEPLAAGQTAQVGFQYTIQSSVGGQDSAQVTIDISGANDCPNAQDDTGGPALETDNAAPLVIDNVLTLLPNDTDPDDGDTLSVLTIFNPVAPPPSFGDFSITLDSGAVVTLDSDAGTITYDGTVGSPMGSDAFGYIGWDGSCTDSAIVTVSITAPIP